MICVYGATGFVGGLVSRELARRGVPFIASARSGDRLGALADALKGTPQTRPADVGDPTSLENAFRGAHVVINCAGPYLHTGAPVVEAAIACGAHYLDICAEQRFLRQVYERYESMARRAEVIVLSGFAFKSALGDWACALASESLAPATDAPLSELNVSYALDGFTPSSGARRSILAQLEEPADRWVVDRWEAELSPGDVGRCAFPPPLGVRDTIAAPSGEVITAPRHIQTSRVDTYMALVGEIPGATWLSRAAAALTPALPSIIRSPLGQFVRDSAFPVLPSESERERTSFAIVAEAKRGDGSARVAIVGRDPYALCAELVVRGAEEIAKSGARPGVLAPAEVFDGREWLKALAVDNWLEVFES